MQLYIWTVILYRLLYGVVSTIVWIYINYCMGLIRVLYGFVSNIIWICIDVYMNCISIVYLIVVIYTPLIKKQPERHLCRVPGPGHTAKVPLFAVYQGRDTRQRCHCLPCARGVTHGKQPLVCCVPGRYGTRQTPFSMGFRALHFILPWAQKSTRQSVCRVSEM